MNFKERVLEGALRLIIIGVLLFIAIGSFFYSKILFTVLLYAVLYMLTVGSYKTCNIASIGLGSITLLFWILNLVYPNNSMINNIYETTYVCGLPFAFLLFVMVANSNNISKTRKIIGLVTPLVVGLVLGWIAKMGIFTGIILYGVTLPLVGSIFFAKDIRAYVKRSNDADLAKREARKSAIAASKEKERLDEIKEEESIRLYNERLQKLSVLNDKLSVISNSNPFNRLVVNEVDFNKTLTYLGNSIVNSDKVKWVKLSEKVSYLINPETHYSNYIQELNSWSRFVRENPIISRALKSDYSGSTMYVNLVEHKARYLIDNYKSAKLGTEGEELINNCLFQYDTIINLADMNITDNGGRESECDNIVVTPNGVFVLEVKNYGSQGVCRFDIDSTGLWKRNGSVLEKSPVEQNSRHLAVVNNILLANGFDIQAKGIVVIANRNAEVDNKSIDTVVRLDSLYSVITQGNRILSRENMKKISDIFNSNNGEAKRFPINCLEEELPIIKDLYDYMVQVRELIIEYRDAFGDDISNWDYIV